MAASSPGRQIDRPLDWQARRVAAWATAMVIVAGLGLLVMTVRVVQLKVAPSQQLVDTMSDPFSTRTSVGRRGDIIDRRGRLLATSTIGWRAFVDPRETEDLATIGVRLNQLIGLDAVSTDRRLSTRLQSRFVPVSDILEDWQVDRIHSADLQGVGLERRQVRVYPHGDVAARLVGTVGFDHEGLGGLEHAMESHLQGQTGTVRFLRDVRRRPLWVEHQGYVPHADGEPVQLSIDLEIQDYVERRLHEAVKTRNAGGGRAIVVDPHTGEILALADVINPREGWPGQPEDPLRETHERLGRNRCVSDPYEPGSTFKPFVWAVATESGVADPDEVLPTPEAIPHRTTSGRRIRDVHYYGPMTWRRVLVKSLNSGMAIVAERMSTELLQSCVSRFGFGQRTGCGIAGETPGIVTSATAWTSYSQVSVSMGHEIAVTPLQMVRGFAAFARDGSVPSLRLLVDRDASPIEQHAVSAETATLVRETLREVMTDGTGRASQSEQYQLFGKSGTAQMPRVEGGGYHEDRYISSFIAGAPLDQPAVVVLCVIDDPDRSLGAWYGGRVAGPVVRDMIDFTLEYLGVPPDLPLDDDSTLAVQR
ncbi:MAG: penicillin-binding protein 2 [Phycisphaerales bacterium]|nr:penicillin-binding protein 2 [Phycisphaerales bacterium]